MNKILTELTSYVHSYSAQHPGCSKSEIAEATASRFKLKRARSVFYRSEFAIRFSTTSGSSFSNVVLSLSALRNYDQAPFIVCVVRRGSVQLLLANTTFLNKISHSSHKLRIDNIRGSFLGHDIVRVYDGIENSPENFDLLFDIHCQFTWEENLVRLVERTKAIVPTGILFKPSDQEEQKILDAPKIAKMLTNHQEYLQLYERLNELVQNNKDAILKAAKINNVNLRGNKIEQIITETGSFHSLEDLSWTLDVGPEVKIDIKTKILTLTSSPKGYNIDKALNQLSVGNIVISFFFIGIHIEAAYILTCLISIFDQTILDLTRIQFHWAGRNSRGVTQLTGDLKSIFNPNFSENIDIDKARKFLKKLINIKL